MKKKTKICLLIISIVILPPIVVPYFSAWSEINCTHYEINIKTGQKRSYRCLWFFERAKEITETPLSIVLKGETVDVSDIKPWHRVNTFTPRLRRSPHYYFHGAFANIKQFTYIQDLSILTPTEETEVAKTVLKKWQQSGDDHLAGEYLNDLFNSTKEKTEN